MIDWSKPIRTVDGEPARLITEIKNGTYPMVVVYGEGVEDVDIFTLDGKMYDVADPYLENVPEPKEVFLNVYECKDKIEVSGHDSLPRANFAALPDRIALVRIAKTEHGLTTEIL